jgi:DUF1016 N-terminal domain
MKKKPATPKRPAVAKAKPGDLAALLTEVRDLIQSARRSVASVVDTFQVMTNFEIGRRIVEHEQKGAKRAAYGAELLKELSGRLTEEFGRGGSRSSLQNMRTFFLLWEQRVPRICQTASGKLVQSKIRQSASGELAVPQTPSAKFDKLFTLSWSHYVELLGIKDPDERSFYEIESSQSNWNVRELKRQKASSLYERLALSRDKSGIKRLASEGQLITKPEDLFKEPLVLEFLGLDEQARYSESDLESFRFICHPKNCSAKSSSIGPARQRHKPTQHPKGLKIPINET